MRSLILLALGASACAEPVIDLSLKMPAADKGGAFNASCLTAVDVITYGPNFPETPTDLVSRCIEITSPPSTLANLRSALTGKVDVQLPDSGLASVEMYGRRGACPIDEDFPGDLVFYAGGAYIGDDQLELTVAAGSSCDQAPVTVRPIDLIKLTTGTTKGDCAAAKAADLDAGVDMGTLTRTFDDAVVYLWGRAGGFLSNGVAPLSGVSMTVGPESCLAVGAGNPQFAAVSCVDRTLPPVCAMPGEIEAPGVSRAIWIESPDAAKRTKFPYVIFGAAVSATKQPIQGATVEIDPKLGEVVYVEPSGTRLAATGGAATGPSGLFMIYTKTIATVKVSSGALSRTTTVGASYYDPGAVLVMLR